MQNHDRIICQLKKQIAHTRSKIKFYESTPPPSQSFLPSSATIPSQQMVASTNTQTINYNSQLPYNTVSYHPSEQYSSQPTFAYPYKERALKPQAPRLRTISYNSQIFPLLPQNQPIYSKQIHKSNIYNTTASLNNSFRDLDPVHKIKLQLDPIYQPWKQANKTNYRSITENRQSFGNEHNFKMMSILSRKDVEDKQNEEILLRFRKQAEFNKKDKSEQKRRMRELATRQRNMHQKQVHLKCSQDEQWSGIIGLQDIQVSQNSSDIISSQITMQPFVQKQHQLIQNLDNSTIQISNPPVSLAHQLSRSSSTKKMLEKNENLLPPITDEGEDGLKYIRKNLFLRKRNNSKRHFYHQKKQNKISKSINSESLESPQLVSLREEVRSISQIVRSNMPNFRTRNIQRVKTNPEEASNKNEFLEIDDQQRGKENNRIKQEEQQEEGLKNIEIKQIKIPNIRVNNFKIRREAQKQSIRSVQPCSKVMKLSEVFE